MRADKFLKVSRLLKRRTVAAEACSSGLVEVNGKIVKPSHTLKIDDVVTLTLGGYAVTFAVKNLNEKAGKADAALMYEILQEKRI